MSEDKDKKETPKAPVKKKVSKAEQKRLDAQQATINKQKALARNQAVDLVDNVTAQVSLNRAGHLKVVQAIQTIKASNLELDAYESGARTAKQEETDDGRSG